MYSLRLVLLGPIISGAIAVRGLSWRWSFRIAAIFSGALGIFALLVVRETYAPVLLKRKARHLRAQGNEQYVAPLELQPIRMGEIVQKTLLRPLIMLIQDPMLLGCTVLLSYAFGLLYLIFEFYSSYREIYGLNPLEEGLCFLPFLVGALLSCVVFYTYIAPRYARELQQAQTHNPPYKLQPEKRLPIVLVCGPCMAISFFWFGWASYRNAYVPPDSCST